MRNIYFHIAESPDESTGLVLATVTGTRGSTPQKSGSTALFCNGRLIAGTVGGGIIENRIREYAGMCVQGKASACLHYSLEHGLSEKAEAVCGGSVSILVDAGPVSSRDVFREMADSLQKGTGGVLITKVTAWNESLVNIRRYWATSDAMPTLPEQFMTAISREVKSILALKNKATFREFEIPLKGESQPALFFLEPVFPLPRLIIAGAGHIGKALSHQGMLLGFEVTVIDDREEYANVINLPDADNIIVNDIGKAMREIQKDNNTYIAIVTRGHSHDAEALRSCIGSEAAYVGMMGSRSKVAAMRQEFISRKWATEEEWDKICTPIGLKIGSQTVEEIAVSIAAQLVEYKTKDKR